MNRAMVLLLLSALLATRAVSAQETIPAKDPNEQISTVAPGATTRAAPGAEDMGRWGGGRPQSLCHPRPARPADSFNIRFGLFNVTDDRLDVLILNSFRALRGEALLHQSVFDTAAPASGTLTVHYPPDAAGKGPVVLGFTAFTQFKSAAFNTDPDTYDDPDFGATVLDLDQTSIELVYSGDGSGSRRCQGTLAFNAALNASIANIVQVYL